MKRLQILFLWLALALSAYAQPTAGGTYQLTLAKINAAIGSGTLAVGKIGGGTPGAGKYVDGGTGNWTTLPTATTDASLLTSGTLPLARLVGITTTEISATAGIVAGQIASIPNQAASIITSGTMATARLGSGSATASTFLHGDSTWSALVAADIPAHNVSLSNITSGTLATTLALGTQIITSTGNTTWYADTGKTIKLGVNSTPYLTVSGSGVAVAGVISFSGGAGGYGGLISDTTGMAFLNNAANNPYLAFAEATNATSVGQYGGGKLDLDLAQATLDFGDNSVAVTASNTQINGPLSLGQSLIMWQAAPASASAAGTQGQVVWDASYVYICVATNTWKRVAIATW